MFKSLKLFIVLLFVGFQTIAQNKENKWVVGAGIGVAKFASEDAKVVGDQFNFQLPKVNGGGTFWLNPRYGINVQLLFKNVLKDTATAKPHIYFSTGIVYSLKLRTLIPRLWNTTN